MNIVLFGVLSTVAVGGVVGALVFRNPAYTALFLALTMAALGGLYGLLGAPFVAAVQVIIYAGAIMVLFVFVIMMVRFQPDLPPSRKRWTAVLAAILGLAFGLEMFSALSGALSPAVIPSPGEESGSAADIGRLLLSDGLYAFELTSILLLAALVGALVLARKKEKP